MADSLDSLESKVDSVHSYLVERQGLAHLRQEAIRSRKQEMSRLDREFTEKFTVCERQRTEWERRVRSMLEEAALEVKEQMQ